MAFVLVVGAENKLSLLSCRLDYRLYEVEQEHTPICFSVDSLTDLNFSSIVTTE
jgi:hypothetical protein